MSFNRRFPEDEIFSIGTAFAELMERVTLDVPLRRSLERLVSIAERVKELRTGGDEALLKADFERDELVRALALYLKSWSHRRTDAKARKWAHRLYKMAFGDSYTWISSSYSKETKEIHELVSLLLEEHREAASHVPGLVDLVKSLRESQARFAALEHNVKESGSDDPRARSRSLATDFHHELDGFIALVDARYRAYNPQENTTRRALLSPLIEATERMAAD